MIGNEGRITTAQTMIRKIMDCKAVVVKGNGVEIGQGNGVKMRGRQPC